MVNIELHKKSKNKHIASWDYSYAFSALTLLDAHNMCAHCSKDPLDGLEERTVTGFIWHILQLLGMKRTSSMFFQTRELAFKSKNFVIASHVALTFLNILCCILHNNQLIGKPKAHWMSNYCGYYNLFPVVSLKGKKWHQE